MDFGGQAYYTQATVGLTHDGRPDAGEIEDDAGNTYLVVDANGDGRADEAGEYDPSGHLVATGHPDAHGVMVADGGAQQMSEPISTTYLVDPRTGGWRIN